MSSPPAAPPLLEHRIDVEGGRCVNVRERDGAGPPFLLVHGLASNARLWDGVGAHLAAAGHRVVAVDQRGHGLSDRAEDGWSAEAVTGDLVRLADVLGLARPVLAGQSWGGNVVVHAGALHPGRWRAIAAVDGGTIELGPLFRDPTAAWEALQPPRLAGRPAAEVRAMIAEHVEGWPDGALDAQMGNFAVREDGTVQPHLRREDHRAIVEAMWHEGPSGAYPRIEVPVVLMPVRGGAPEWARRKEDGVDAALAALPDGRVRWFDGAHDVHLQKPREVAEALLELA